MTWYRLCSSLAPNWRRSAVYTKSASAFSWVRPWFVPRSMGCGAGLDSALFDQRR
jgi:hypothetical protein